MEQAEVFSPSLRRALPHERTPFNRVYGSCTKTKKRKRGDSASPPLRKKRKRVRKTPGSINRRTTISDSPGFPSRRLSTPVMDFEERKSESLPGISFETSRSRGSRTSTPQAKMTPVAKTKYIQTSLQFPRRQSFEINCTKTIPIRNTPDIRAQLLRSPQRIIQKDDGSKCIIPEYLGTITRVTQSPRSKRLIIPEYLGPISRKKFKLKKISSSTSKIQRRISQSTPTSRKKRLKPTFVGPLDDTYVAESPDSSFQHPDGTNSNPGPLTCVKKSPNSLEYQKLSVFSLLG